MANMGIAGKTENRIASTYNDDYAMHQVLRFFIPMITRDSSLRAASVDSICEAIYLKAIGKTTDPFGWTVNNHGGYNGIHHNGNDDPNAAGLPPKATLQHYLPIILMHSFMCPFSEVRSGFQQLLERLKSHGIKVPRVLVDSPTSFFQVDSILTNPETEEQAQQLFIDAFLQNGRFDHITQIMGYHPAYLECFLKTQHFLLRGDGPLPYDYRHYIAIIAAARHHCVSLINIHRQEFLLQGGDPMWLRGLDYIPQKLRDLYEINKILAHQPWLITRSHIHKLTKGSSEGWSLSEVVHAIALLVHFHSLAGFVYGCGINSEIDEENGHTYRPPSMSDSGTGSDTDASGGGSPTAPDFEIGDVDILMKRMKTLSEQSQEERSHEELLKTFEKVESQVVEVNLPITEAFLKNKADVSQFIEDENFQHVDYKRCASANIIRIQNFSWDDHGYPLVNRLYNDFGTLLDDKFRTAYGLTYNTMGTKKDVDTSTFRRAIWNYVHCVYGIRHDDYNYHEMEKLLDKHLAIYIKTVCCFPELTTKNSYESCMKHFRHSEKVHVNLMVLEARMQGELLYALRAIMWSMT